MRARVCACVHSCACVCVHGLHRLAKSSAAHKYDIYQIGLSSLICFYNRSGKHFEQLQASSSHYEICRKWHGIQFWLTFLEYSRVECRGANGVLICINNRIVTWFNHNMLCKNTKTCYVQFVLVLLLPPLCVEFLCLALSSLKTQLAMEVWAGCLDKCILPLFMHVCSRGGQGVLTPHPEKSKK